MAWNTSAFIGGSFPDLTLRLAASEVKRRCACPVDGNKESIRELSQDVNRLTLAVEVAFFRLRDFLPNNIPNLQAPVFDPRFDIGDKTRHVD